MWVLTGVASWAKLLGLVPAVAEAVLGPQHHRQAAAAGKAHGADAILVDKVIRAVSPDPIQCRKGIVGVTAFPRETEIQRPLLVAPLGILCYHALVA